MRFGVEALAEGLRRKRDGGGVFGSGGLEYALSYVVVVVEETIEAMMP